ncbi:precorrin-2 dehydrogenase SirC [Gottschalkia purinilytica]|uniref:precorrin-2 dehydrogenase n=1 Tax=Gottschalkia purinilytica TaxID=1503 RepID=A0A0L0W724_GOTPU|nr:NAD(P)-dependent oxidoreductase [Gottschalkia purinilytica]KNF07353.1 precorrin-2 dehydrogenase SirC [Gottschalkia purinilytica]
MPKNNREDILLGYAFISLISNKTKVLIVGGGKSGFIKAKSFLDRGCNVSVLSKKFDNKFEEVKNKENIDLIKSSYEREYILDKHIIIIATDDMKLNERIKKDCDSLYKIYLTTSDFKDGLFVTPTQRCTEKTMFSIHTKSGSPKTSVFLAEKMKENLSKYDDFIEFVCDTRNKIDNRNLKYEIMNFINTDDFYFFYSKGKHKLILEMFYPSE